MSAVCTMLLVIVIIYFSNICILVFSVLIFFLLPYTHNEILININMDYKLI